MNACKEDWGAMSPTEGGRYCGRCQHAVVDFTGWSRTAVAAYKQQHPDACGLYDLEHIHPHLVPLVDLLRPARSVLVAGLALGSIQAVAQSEAPYPTEQLPTATPNTPAAVIADKPDGVHDTCPVPVDTAPARLRHKPYRRLYVSKRFPFIHIRRRFTMGAMVFHPYSKSSRSMAVGTPSF